MRQSVLHTGRPRRCRPRRATRPVSQPHPSRQGCSLAFVPESRRKAQGRSLLSVPDEIRPPLADPARPCRTSSCRQNHSKPGFPHYFLVDSRSHGRKSHSSTIRASQARPNRARSAVGLHLARSAVMLEVKVKSGAAELCSGRNRNRPQGTPVVGARKISRLCG